MVESVKRIVMLFLDEIEGSDSLRKVGMCETLGGVSVHVNPLGMVAAEAEVGTRQAGRYISGRRVHLRLRLGFGEDADFTSDSIAASKAEHRNSHSL